MFLFLKKNREKFLKIKRLFVICINNSSFEKIISDILLIKIILNAYSQYPGWSKKQTCLPYSISVLLS